MIKYFTLAITWNQTVRFCTRSRRLPGLTPQYASSCCSHNTSLFLPSSSSSCSPQTTWSGSNSSSCFSICTFSTWLLQCTVGQVTELNNCTVTTCYSDHDTVRVREESERTVDALRQQIQNLRWERDELSEDGQNRLHRLMASMACQFINSGAWLVLEIDMVLTCG